MNRRDRARRDARTLEAPPRTVGGKGLTLEFVGAPGSGKSVIAPRFKRVLVDEDGWRTTDELSLYGGQGGGNAREVEEFHAELLKAQAHRVLSWRIPYAYAYAYIGRCTQHLTWSRGAQEPHCVAANWFLNESLLHHFAEEILAWWDAVRPTRSDLAATIGSRRAVIETTSATSDVVARLETRRGTPAHWDWATAFGNNLEAFVAAAGEARGELVGRLASSGWFTRTIAVPITDASECLIQVNHAIAALRALQDEASPTRAR